MNYALKSIMKHKLLAILCLIFFVFSSCEQEEELLSQNFSYTQVFDMDNGVTNTTSYIEGNNAHSGKWFSRTDSSVNFGFGYSYILPDSLMGRAVDLSVEGWVRTGDIKNNCELVISVSTPDSLYIWVGCDVKNAIKNPNEWTFVSNSFRVGPEITSKPNLKFTILAHNVDAKSYFDVDDVKLSIKEEF